MNRKKCVAMLLAGGQGSRLGVLTSKIAKPAVPYGGKYRIIDFPLSNCVNSGIDTVGILTQYKPLELNDYVGSGKPWDLDRTSGGVFSRRIRDSRAATGIREPLTRYIRTSSLSKGITRRLCWCFRATISTKWIIPR